MDFALSESDQADEFALKLSMTKRVPIEMAVFEDGEKVEGLRVPRFTVDYGNGEKTSESQS